MDCFYEEQGENRAVIFRTYRSFSPRLAFIVLKAYHADGCHQITTVIEALSTLAKLASWTAVKINVSSQAIV